jgi:hypothetical protein
LIRAGLVGWVTARARSMDLTVLTGLAGERDSFREAVLCEGIVGWKQYGRLGAGKRRDAVKGVE